MGLGHWVEARVPANSILPGAFVETLQKVAPNRVDIEVDSASQFTVPFMFRQLCWGCG